MDATDTYSLSLSADPGQHVSMSRNLVFNPKMTLVDLVQAMRARGGVAPLKPPGMVSSAMSCCLDPVRVCFGATCRFGLLSCVNACSVGCVCACDVPRCDGNKIAAETHNMFKGWFKEEDYSQYAYDVKEGEKPGRLTAKEMIYSARLSIIAYLTSEITFSEFLDENRQNELMTEYNFHNAFFLRFITDLFDNEPSSSTFGKSIDVEDALKPMNLKLQKKFISEKTSTEGFVATSFDFKEKGGDLVIAFQGTVQRQDFFTSLHGSKTVFEPIYDEGNAGACPCCQDVVLGRCFTGETAKTNQDGRKSKKTLGRVHVGFYESFLSVKTEIKEQLVTLLEGMENTNKNIRIVVTGHSLGGALATLCSAFLMQWFRHERGGLPDNVRVLSVTFGSPKMGDAVFVNNLDHDDWATWDTASGRKAKFKTYRIFAPLDPVPTTPPLALGFRHCYGMASIKDGSLYFLPPKYANRVDTTSQGIRLTIDKGTQILTHHDIFTYCLSVMQFAQRTFDNMGEFKNVRFDEEVRDPQFLERF